MECPFCNEKDFDKVGLKNHLEYYCEEYENTLTVKEEKELWDTLKGKQNDEV